MRQLISVDLPAPVLPTIPTFYKPASAGFSNLPNKQYPTVPIVIVNDIKINLIYNQELAPSIVIFILLFRFTR
jgi:hypothetical protein